MASPAGRLLQAAQSRRRKRRAPAWERAAGSGTRPRGRAPGVANMLAKSLAPTMTPVSALDTPSRVQNVPTVGTASM